jgi:hypothetical protein
VHLFTSSGTDQVVTAGEPTLPATLTATPAASAANAYVFVA